MLFGRLGFEESGAAVKTKDPLTLAFSPEYEGARVWERAVAHRRCVQMRSAVSAQKRQIFDGKSRVVYRCQKRAWALFKEEETCEFD